jgi:hypothetical protein
LDVDIAQMRQSGAAVAANRRADEAWDRLMSMVAA